MEIIVGFFDDDNDPITGGAANTTIKLRRVTDGYLFDFDDSTFKASGWTTVADALAEVDATNLAGYYKKVITISGFNDGNYQVFVSYSDAVTRNGDLEVIIKDGEIINEIVSTFDPASDEVDIGAVKGAAVSGVNDFKATGFSTHAAADVWSVATRRVSDATNITSDAGTIDQTKIANLDAAVSTRSTLTAQNVWEYATRTLSSFGTLVSDMATAVWGAVARTLTAGTKDSAIDDIKAKTDKIAFTGADPYYVNSQVKAQDNIDFGALQKTSLNAATPASVQGAVGSVTNGVTVTTNNDKTGYALTEAYDSAFSTMLSDLTTLVGRLTALRAGYLDNLSGGAVALQSYVDEVESLLGNATYGLAALKTAIGSGSTTLILPAMQAGAFSTYATQGREVKVKRGDGGTPIRVPFQIQGDWSSGWTGQFGAKARKTDETYAVGPVDCVMGEYNAQGDYTSGYFELSSTDTATAYKKLFAEIEMQSGESVYTPLEFYFTIDQDVIRALPEGP